LATSIFEPIYPPLRSGVDMCRAGRELVALGFMKVVAHTAVYVQGVVEQARWPQRRRVAMVASGHGGRGGR
jgi:hypothetical protein